MGKLTVHEPRKTVKKALDSEYLSAYAGKWVFVEDEKVIASAKKPQTLLKKVPKKIEGNAFLFKVPLPGENLLVV